MNQLNDPDFNRIMNLIRFISNFTKHENGMKLSVQSPGYVLEKYNHWIGFQPTVETIIDTPDELVSFLSEYYATWNPNLETFSKIKNILMYLKLTENMKFTDMVSRFEEYIGPFSRIKQNEMRGLHPLVEELVDLVFKSNQRDIKLFLWTKE